MSRRYPHTDGRYDPRTPSDAPSLVGMLAFVALVPLALWAATYPTLAATALATTAVVLLLARFGMARAVRRLRGRSTAFELPGLGARVEVSLSPKLNR